MAEPLPREADPGTVDADNPWPGLASFREADRELFYGRETETQEVLRLALRERLTVLFGLSGLGKTSLLRAGLFPRLREQNVLPVYIRLDFSEGGGARRTLTDQIRQAIAREARAAGIEAPPLPESETLWESLHRQEAEFWSPRNRIVTPLLVFDQFEEVFTLGQRNPSRARETEAFLAELADLCEGSPPASVRERLEADPSAARELSFTRHAYKILLSLREDFLPELEGLRGRIRSIVHNRFRLRRMNGDNALKVITQAGGHLVEPDVPERVVRFVAGKESDGAVPLAGLEIEPALLSVVCRELNNKRRAQGLSRITAGLVSGNRDEILSELYERSVEDLGPEVRAFVEERLLTRSGFRDTVALENALELPGVTREALDRLTDRRLLRIEDRGGMQRLELTHDVLTGVIRKSRDLRREREAERKLRRSWLIIALLALVLVGVFTLAAWALWAERRAEQALAASDAGRALSLRDSRPSHALAYLARALRADPDNIPAQSVLSDLLLGRAWPRPVAELRLADADSVHLSEDGRFFAAVSEDWTVRVWDTRTLQKTGTVRPEDAAESLELSRDGRRMLILSPALARLWDVRTGQPLGRFPLREERSHALLSPDGQWIALVYGGHTLVLRHIDTGKEREIRLPVDPAMIPYGGGFEGFGFSPDSRRFFATDSLAVLLWDVGSGRSIPGPPAGMILHVVFSPDSRRLLVTGNELVVWDTVVGGPSEGTFGGDANRAWLSPRGGRLATYHAPEAALRIWSIRDPRGPLTISKPNLLHAQFSHDGQLLLTTSQEGVELWDADTGHPVSQPLCDCLQGRFLEGTRQVVTSDDSGILRVWSSEPARTGTELLYDSESLYPVFSQDGSRLALQSRDGVVHFWDTTAVRSVESPVRNVDLRLSADGRFLLEQRKSTVQLWDARTGRRTGQPLTLPGDRYQLRPDKDLDSEREVLGIRRGSTVQLWSFATGRQVGEVQQSQEVTDLAFSPGGDRLVTVSPQGVIRTWDSRTGEPLDLVYHESPVVSFDLSQDGERIATGTRRGLARIWDLRSGELLVGPLRHRYPVSFVKFQPAGRLLLTRAQNTLRLWDTRTGQPTGGALDQKGGIGFAQLSPDGSRILVQTIGESPLLLDAQTGQLLVRASLPVPDSTFYEARLSPTGELLWVALLDRVHVFAVPLFPKKDRELLARWAEAVGGWTLDGEGRLVEIRDQLARLNGLRRETAKAPLGQLGVASLIRWFLSDPRTRTMSPVLDLTVEQSIRRHLEAGDWRGAAEAFPGHPLLLEHRPPPVPITPDEP
ncbi:MAG TPA: WD40 repeat domain-containing protein [Thermoanaerobaculia bacterium]